MAIKKLFADKFGKMWDVKYIDKTLSSIFSIHPEDRVQIKIKANGTEIGINDGSPGQKCAAILAFIMNQSSWRRAATGTTCTPTSPRKSSRRMSASWNRRVPSATWSSTSAARISAFTGAARASSWVSCCASGGGCRHEAKPNPYVGPRAFEIGETLYGRERELRQPQIAAGG